MKSPWSFFFGGLAVLCLIAIMGQRMGGRRTDTVLANTVVNLPSSPPTNTFRRVTDGDTASDCTTGNSNNSVLCYYTGSAWASLGDGGGASSAHGDLSGLVAPADDHTQYLLAETSAGAPAANICDRSGHNIIDETNNNPYFCSDGVSGSARAFSSLGDSFNTVSDGTNTGSASGAQTVQYGRIKAIETMVTAVPEVEVFSFTSTFTNQPSNDGIELVSSSSSDTTQVVTLYGTTNGGDESNVSVEELTVTGTDQVTSAKTDWANLLAVKMSATALGTVTIREASGDATIIALAIGATRTANLDSVFVGNPNRVKSVLLSWSADNTECKNATEVTIGSWGKQWTYICTDNDAAILTGTISAMPDGWDGGTVTLELPYIQDAADTSAFEFDVSGRCAGDTETPQALGSEVNVIDAAVTGTDAKDSATSGAVTLAGTCAAGDMVQIQVAIDASGTGTAMATLNILDGKLEYTVLGGGSD